MKDNALFGNDGEEKYVYFVHSYHAAGVPKRNIIAGNGVWIPVCFRRSKGQFVRLAVSSGKSGETGLNMLKNFGGLKL